MALPVRNFRIRLTQGQLFCREVGNGQAIVFLHGSWGEGSEWLPVMELLERECHSLAPDLLGCGDSDRPKVHYSLALQVECLAAYLDALRLQKVVLVGRELGGWVAARYAAKYPEQVKGLVLMAAEGVQITTTPNRWQRERWLAARPSLYGGLLRSLFPLARFLKRHHGIEQLLALQQTLRRSPVACQILFQRRRTEIQAEWMSDQIPWLKPPVLILQGEGDRSVATALNRAYSQAPNVDLRLIPEAGEAMIQTHPEAIAEEIRRFLT